MKKAAFITLGCKVNFYDSEAMAELFRAKGYEIVSPEEPADVYVINTCTVTNFGDKKSRQAIRRARKQNPHAIIAAAGCYTQTHPEEVAKIEGVNILIGTSERSRIVEITESCKADGIVDCVGDIMKVREFERLSIETLKDRTRAYIKIQEGCNRFCSYCMIPYARGPVRSRPLDDILNEVEKLSENGFKEVVLTGIHVASYGLDLKNVGLTDVLERVSETDGIERIRFSSVEPTVITDEFMEILGKLPKVCHHFHLSLQSGCDRILKLMNRRYTTEEYYRAVCRIRQLWEDAAITTDIIAGFPTETEEDFSESTAFAEKCGFYKIHAFPYSPKKGTPAAEMKPQTDAETKQERVGRLIKLSEEGSTAFMKKLNGKTCGVLFERRNKEGFYEGHTSNYVKVLVKSDECVINKIADVRIGEAVSEGIVYGEIENSRKNS